MDEVIEKYGTSNGHLYNVDETKSYSDGAFWPCVVIGREDSSDVVGDRYTVRILQSPFYESTEWEKMKLPRIISNFTRPSIRHFYLPYKSDLHLPIAFRHHIDLPDDLVQAQWRDRR